MTSSSPPPQKARGGLEREPQLRKEDRQRERGSGDSSEIEVSQFPRKVCDP